MFVAVLCFIIPASCQVSAQSQNERSSLELAHLKAAEERNELMLERVKKFCQEHKGVKSLQRTVADAQGFMVDPDHKLAFCRHGKE